jgi:predicted O-methyltransferase YrrM
MIPQSLNWLFQGETRKNRNVIRCDRDEAEYIYDLVKNLDSPYAVEIGRMLGGSAILMASAGAHVVSLDLHVSKTVEGEKGALADIALDKKLQELGLRNKVDILVADSHTYNTTSLIEKVDVLFIDGDHSYEGVKKDYENWVKTVKPGGHILFHDACRSRGGATCVAEVKRFVDTVPLMRIKDVGSIVHFVKE